MPFIPDAPISAESTTENSSSEGRFIPDTTDTISTSPATITSPHEASGVIGTTLGAAASGLMKGSESILNTMQGGANVIGGVTNIEPGGGLGKAANQIERDRVQFIGNQESLHGKVIEQLFQLPSLVAMVGNPESVGLLGAKGGLEAFAGQAILQAQPTVQGKPLTEQIGDLSWIGGKAAMFGAVIGKSMTMGPVSGPALAGLYSSGQTALEGGDPNDILAGAIIGAGMTTLSNPKHLASVLTADNVSEGASTMSRGAKNAISIMAGKGPLTGMAEIIGEQGTDYVKKVSRLMDASDKKARIEEHIGQLDTKAQIEAKELATQKAEQVAKAKKDASDAILGNKDIIGTIKTKKANDIEQTHAELGLLKDQTAKIMDSVDGELNKSIWSTIDSLKSGGKLDTMFKDINTAFANGINHIGKLLSGEKPLTRFDLQDMCVSIIERARDANGKLDSNSKTMQAVNRLIDQLKFEPFKSPKEIQQQISNMKQAGVPQDAINQYIFKNAKIDMAEVIPFKTAKVMVDRIKNADPLGSHEADIARQQFATKIRQKLSENGQDTSSFDRLMSDMSTALNIKETLTSSVQLTDKATISNPTMFGLLRDLATGKIDSGVENPAKSRLLDAMQNGLTIGNERVAGVDYSKEILKQMGINLESIKTKFDNIGEKENATIINIGKEFVANMAKAEVEGRNTIQRVGLEHKLAMQKLADAKTALEENTTSRMKTLEGRRDMQQDLIDRKNDIVATMNSVGFGISMYALRFGRVLRAGANLLRRGNTGFGKKP